MYVPGLPKTQAFMNQLTWIMNGAANDPKMKNTMGRDFNSYRLRPSDLAIELRGCGFRVLGSGHYSVVLDPSADVITEQQSRSWVVKLGCTVEDNWLAFAVYCMQHPAPWFPKVHKIAIHDKFYIVIMERLSTAHDLPAGMYRSDDQVTLWNKFCDKFPQARHLESTLGRPDDTHYQNFMYRSDVLVCTDPYHYGGYEKRPKPGDAYRPTVIDESNIRELATGSGEFTTRVQQEGNALRLKSIDEVNCGPIKGLGILPQVRRDAAVSKKWFVKPRAIEPVGIKARVEDFAMANRRLESVQGRRADIIVMDDVAAKGSNGPRTQKRIRDAVEWFAQKRPAPNFVHAWDAAFLNKALAHGRPGQEKVCDERPLADWEAFPIAEPQGRGPKAQRAKL